MRLPFFLAAFLCLCFSTASRAAAVQGTVKDSMGQPIPYASVFVKNSSYGVPSDAEGTYFLELPAGTYTLNIVAVGYDVKEVSITLKPSQTLTLDIILQVSAMGMGEVVLSTKHIDRGKEIMRKVRKQGKVYDDAVETYTCNTYQKISVEKIETARDTSGADTLTKREKRKAEKKQRKEERDSIKALDTTGAFAFLKKKKKGPTVEQRGYEAYAKLRHMNLIESVEETSYEQPGKYKVIVKGFHDFSDIKLQSSSSSVYLGYEYGEPDIAAVGREYDDPYLIKFRPSETDFNFYRNQIDAPRLCEKPLLSPLASTAELSYRFSLDTAFFDSSGRKIYRIKVDPIFKSEPLFSGILYVEDSTWAVQSVDFAINPDALLFCKEFRINQDFTEVGPGIHLPTRREFTYTIKDGRTLHKGNTRVDHKDYVVNKTFPKRFFTNEIMTYDTRAFDKDSIWWDSLRSITLKENELAYIKKSDSVRNYLESENYLDSFDAEYNKLDIWDFLFTGIEHRNHYKKYDYTISSLIQQVKPFGIGGYRHGLAVGLVKEFENNFLLETNARADYGFANRDLKGGLGVGLTYVPLRFVRTMIDVGDYYDVVNTYPSLSTLFARSNYVRARTISISQRMELLNGLFGEVAFDYASLDPLTDLQMDRWTEVIYGELNEPTDFRPYKKTEVKLTLKYRPAQKFIIKGNKKIILGSKYPEFSFVYRKGIKGAFKSEVDFDYLELGAKQELQFGRFGYGSWNILAGAFTNTRSLRVIEYKYFRGSDPLFFSDPLTSFQLLGPTLSTSRSYLRAGGIFHDQGYLFNKIPVLNKCRLGLAAGGSYLAVPEQDHFRHAEIFGGVEWIFRIKKQLFRLGVYGVTAENTVSLPDLTWKVGLNVFGDRNNSWNY